MQFRIQDGKRRLSAFCAPAVLVGSFAWALGLARIFMYGGDGMIGFHPLVFLTPWFVLLLVSILVPAIIFRKVVVLLAAIAGLVSVSVCDRNALRLNQWGWERNISKYAAANEMVIQKLVGPDMEKTLLKPPDFMWNEKALIPLPEFRWFSLHHGIAAPRGTYYGFVFAGVPHVRVRKIRHGWMGLAFVSDSKQLDKLKGTERPWAYLPSVSAHWVTWRMDDKVSGFTAVRLKTL